MKDAAFRNVIGPWADDGAPSLDEFQARENFVVQAAAGSGKTTALVARMVALVRTGVAVEHLAAITFTRKAAGEMNERFFAELQQARAALQRSGRDVQAERVDAALNDVQRCFIGTIHAFCARLLRERPIEAGLPPDFTAGIDDRDERQLRERAWSRHLTTTWRTDRKAFARVQEAGLQPDALFDFFGDLCGVPELEPFVDGPEDPPDLSDAVREAHAFLDTWRAEIPDPRPETSPGKTLEAFDKAERFRTYRSLNAPATQAEFLDLFSGLLKSDTRKSTDTDERGNVKKSAWKPNKAAADRLDDEALPDFVQGTIRPVLRQWKAYVHRVAVEFTCPVVEHFSELRRQEGKLTFQDLLLTARNLLRDHPDVREHFQGRFRHLLVDEFQDTDPIQAQLLFYLTAEDPTETDWRNCTPKPGRLFIVGDDKQSIYRFRRADMEVFEQVGDLIEAAGGRPDVLTTNFRSVAPICTWCNEAFGELYAEPELSDVQADYVDFEPHREAGDDPLPIRQIELDKVAYHKPDPIAEADADAIARAIRADCVSGERSFGDHMILTRLSKRLKIYAETLSTYGIPYTITGSKDLDTSPELRALVDLLTCVERPNDPVARVAYLRGRLVGLSDDALFRYRRAMHAADDDPDFSTEELPVPDALDDDLRGRLSEAKAHLTRAKWALGTFRPAAAIERMMDDLGLWAMASRPSQGAGNGSLRAGHLVRVLVIVQHHDAQGLHWTRIREELQRILDGDETVDGMTLETGTDEAVRLMNVHQAKGLQAPVVFLADPYDRYHRPTPSQHVRRDEGDVVLPVARRFGAGRAITEGAPKAWEETYKDEEQRHHEAEERRLQYVAATRAKDRLVISRYLPKPEDGFWAALYPYLDRHNVPVLEPPAPRGTTPSDAATNGTAQIDHVADLKTARARFEEKKQRVKTKSYTVESLRGDDLDKTGPGRGKGRVYGTLVHQVLEHLVLHRHNDTLLDDILSAPVLRHLLRTQENGGDVDERLIDNAQEAAKKFLTSDVWDALLAAPSVHTEWPVARVPDAARSGHTQNGGTIEQGEIDLLYQSDDGWVLLDYKTDLTGIDVIPSAYRAQIDAYARAWMEATGETVTRRGLWDTETGRFLSAETRS